MAPRQEETDGTLGTGSSYDANEALAEHLPPLSEFEALEEANRCIYCYDAPCTHACPTHIDIPRFIKKIATGNLTGSARTIFQSNLLGATCARVCPVQELCEGACVLGPTHKPIAIGRLQRYSMDYAYSHDVRPSGTSAVTGRKVAVIGAGPAGLSCAGELRKFGHSVTLFDKRELPGGLSTYGIIGLREPLPVALAEAAMIESMGVKFERGSELGGKLSLEQLHSEFDCIVLSVGLGATPEIGIPGEEHIVQGLTYVEYSKTAPGLLPAGEEVVVIGAGNTAIDCATIARRTGSKRVTIVYRRTDCEMTAYPHEYEFAKKEGIEFRFLTQPVEVLADGGQVKGLRCVRMQLGAVMDASGRPVPQPLPESDFLVPADLVVKAVGQAKPKLAALLGLETDKGFISISSEYETSLPGLFAIGDCVRAKGAASTVMATQDGKLAASAIHKRLSNTPPAAIQG